MTTQDTYNLILAIWREARGQNSDAQRGVYWVIMNRVVDGRWPSTISGVILQREQFSSFNPNDPNFKVYPTATTSPYSFMQVIDNPGDDPTGGATHYHSYPQGDPHWPSWATADKQTVKIGAFYFYKL